MRFVLWCLSGSGLSRIFSRLGSTTICCWDALFGHILGLWQYGAASRLSPSSQDPQGHWGHVRKLWGIAWWPMLFYIVSSAAADSVWLDIMFEEPSMWLPCMLWERLAISRQKILELMWEKEQNLVLFVENIHLTMVLSFQIRYEILFLDTMGVSWCLYQMRCSFISKGLTESLWVTHSPWYLYIQCSMYDH